MILVPFIELFIPAIMSQSYFTKIMFNDNKFDFDFQYTFE